MGQKNDLGVQIWKNQLNCLDLGEIFALAIWVQLWLHKF